MEQDFARVDAGDAIRSCGFAGGGGFRFHG
jgi:hypothetical protein